MFNTEDAAVILGVSPKTLANWRCYGLGPAYQKGRKGSVLYSAESLLKFGKARNAPKPKAAPRKRKKKRGPKKKSVRQLTRRAARDALSEKRSGRMLRTGELGKEKIAKNCRTYLR